MGIYLYWQVRDLCLVSRADGHSTDAEREALKEIASALEIAPMFIDKTLDSETELD